MRVLIADDHSIVRSGLSYLVSELADPVTVDTATSMQQLDDLLARPDGVDMVIMDLHMPGFTGLSDLDRVVARVAPAPVVVFSMVDSPDEMRSVLGCGVRAYVPKSTDDALFVNILRLVLAGGTYVPPVLGMTGDAAAPGKPTLVTLTPDRPTGGGLARRPAPFDQLTRRQLEVLDLMALGLSNQDIGDRLGLNLSTVKTHVTGVLKALGVESRTQAVLLVKESGIDRLA
jgi:DNA-binding NarL/FixJ family response regulator